MDKKEVPTIDKPARVGGREFAAGTPVADVILAAQRQFVLGTPARAKAHRVRQLQRMFPRYKLGRQPALQPAPENAEESSADQPALAVPEVWRDMVGKAHRFIREVGEHGVTCAIYDLDEDGKHIQCTCGMDETLRGLSALLAAAQQNGGAQ